MITSIMNLPDAVTHAFDTEGRFIGAELFGCGRINRTYLASYELDDMSVRYIHQRINTEVFKDPGVVMSNLVAVTRYITQRLSDDGIGEYELRRRVLTPVPLKSGGFLLLLPDGSYWRTSHYVEGSSALLQVSAEAAYEAARSFGRFLRMLDGFPVDQLKEVIPGFHNTAQRVSYFKKVAEINSVDRLAGCQEDVDALANRSKRAGRLQELTNQGILPIRAVHNDTKLNNVLFDARTSRALCVVDLDTVMGGISAHDFGDMVRSAANTCSEDAEDPSEASLDMEHYKSLHSGFLDAAGDILQDAEKEMLPEGVWAMTYELAVRFLTDHLAGDVYFGVSQEGQNLERARVQLALLRDIERKWSDL